jgi:mono/diheme cytochrome c family protein
VKGPFLAGALLVTLVAHPARAQTPPPDGQALYREHCRTCHGVAGKPTDFARHAYAKIPVFSEPAFSAGRSQDSIVAVLTRGVGKGQNMRSFKNLLTHDQMVAVARYVRALSGAAAKSP